MHADLHELSKENYFAGRSRWLAEIKLFFFPRKTEAERVRTNGYWTSAIKPYLVTECLDIFRAEFLIGKQRLAVKCAHIPR